MINKLSIISAFTLSFEHVSNLHRVNISIFISAGARNVTCFSPLGMESGHIPDISIIASSRYTEYRGPERGRLNLQRNGNVSVFEQ